MQIDYADGLFLAIIKFEERQAFINAEWKWHADIKRWATRDPRKADIFAPFTTPAAQTALAEWRQKEYGELTLSCAVTCDIDIPRPAGLEYDPWQRAGIVYASRRKDTLIADPPGVGKTQQAVGVSNYNPEIQRVLVVSPAHLKVNWAREWAKWCVKGLTIGEAKSVTKSEAVRDADGKSVKDPETGRYKRRTWIEYDWPKTQVVIINYDMLPTFREHIEALEWDLAVFDESQYLVSDKAQRSRHVFGALAQRVAKTKTKKGFWRPPVKGIQAKRRLFLSGTPVLSRPIDIWTLCKACDPAGLGKDWEEFVYTYCAAKVYNAGQSDERTDTSGASNLPELQRHLRTRFMVRRPKSILNLKEKRRQLIPLPQEGLVKLVEAEMTAGERVRAALAAFETMQADEAPKEEAVWTSLADALERRFAGWQDRSYEDCIQYLGAAEQAAFEELSLARKALAKAKIPMVKEHLEGLLATGAKVVCFFVHTEIAESLRVHFPTAAFITGKVPANKRQAQVDRFQTDPECRLMLGNITAAGTGFTMTAGTIVVFAELDWVPARVEQGEDRCHRRGQTEMVLVQHLAVEGSLDVRLVEVLLQKQLVVEATLDHNTLPEFLKIEDLLKKEIEDDSRTTSTFRLQSV
jgi:SNF2 family DNA or RNA helicase